MFIIELTYKVSNEEIDKFIGAHRSFLDKYYAAGVFIASGAQVPRKGGIILANAPSREAIQSIIGEDPFFINGLSDYRVVEFNATKKAANIDAHNWT
ncbi:MAG TPA: YciI family protein [Puia sp.]|nr:YciI family protein [Puia sp.]